MSSHKRGRITITKQHALTMRGVLMWLEQQPEPSQLEIDVLTEIVERVEKFAHNGALIRTRILNAGTPPSERARRARKVAHGSKARTADTPSAAVESVTLGQPMPPWNAWTDAERDRLLTLYRERVPLALIAERMERSIGAIEHQVERLGLRGTRLKPRPQPGTVAYRHADSPLRRAKDVIQRRRREAVAA